MALKIRLFLLLTVLVMALYHVQVHDALKCDWPKGICTFVGDPCPENMERCSQNDKGCPSATNHCCCDVKKAEPVKEVPKVEVLDKPCEWPNGTCIGTHDRCPLHRLRCPKFDLGCDPPTNHCCCSTTPPPPPGQCEWPRGTCTHTGDPCPPNWVRCPLFDSGCLLPETHCCCRTTPTPPPGKCDWPRGTCTYVGDPCPPGWKPCPDYDIDCVLKSSRCCCHS